MVMNDSSDKFEAILSSFTDAVMILDAERRIEWMNTAAEQLFGVSMNQVSGREMSALFPKDGEIHSEVIRAMEKGVTLIDHDVMLRIGKEEPVPVVLTVYPVEREGKKGAAVALRNLTRLKALERSIKLHERVAEIAVLAAGIAHEIKNPLSGIRGAAQLLGSELKENSKESYTDVIIKESDRINRLLVDLIELNQPGEFPRVPVNIYPILDEVVKLLRAEFEKKKIKVERIFDPSLPPILGDPDRLLQIFLNLIKNAVEACGERGEVTLKTALALPVSGLVPMMMERRFAIIEVIDDGPGVDEKIRPYLFTPFFSRKSNGSGLGLPITLNLVQAHNGFLEINNRKDGKQGAAASVYLPYSV